MTMLLPFSSQSLFPRRLHGLLRLRPAVVAGAIPSYVSSLRRPQLEVKKNVDIDSLEVLYDDKFGTESVKDYLDASREIIRPDGGPPRWFCPIECGQPIKGAPLLLFLPGVDGTGFGLILHHKSLGRAFEVRCLHIPVNDRSQFKETCDIFTGKWVPIPSGLPYTNETCHFIEVPQNCLKNGRPDTRYLFWRWKPYGCSIPPFDGVRFLDAMQNKAWALIGDSILRNHVQSLICLLSKVMHLH